MKIIKITIAVITTVLFVACDEAEKIVDDNPKTKFYKFFDPFNFKGIQEINSTSKDYPFYELHYDSLRNITRMVEYFSEKEMEHSIVRYGKNVKILVDSGRGAFANDVVMKYQFIYPQKVISIVNFRFTTSGRTHTAILNIYTPYRDEEYILFGDGKLDQLDVDSSYLKKTTYISPEDILSNTFTIKESAIERKSIRDISNEKDRILVKTVFVNEDTTINETFIYDNRKYDNFWIGKYNFFDSISFKLYYNKHYK